MKSTAPYTTIDFREHPPNRELRPFEVGETLFACVLEDCNWSATVPIFQPPADALGGIFGVGALVSSAVQQHHWEVERILTEHYRKHSIEDFMRTIVSLRREIDVQNVTLMMPRANCGEIMPDTGTRCIRKLYHADEMHAGVDDNDNFHTWR